MINIEIARELYGILIHHARLKQLQNKHIKVLETSESFHKFCSFLYYYFK